MYLGSRSETLLRRWVWVWKRGAEHLLRLKIMLASPDNHFEITGFNTASGLVSGNFNLIFEFDERHGNRGDFTEPDTIRFTNGKFSFRLEQ